MKIRRCTRRLIVSIVFVTAFSMALARPTGAGPRLSSGGFVLASFEWQDTHFWIDAWKEPGATAHGQMNVATFPNARIDCLTVRDNEAFLIADIPQWRFVFYVVIRDGRHHPDEMVSFNALEGPAPQRCPRFDGSDAPGDPVLGDISIHEAPSEAVSSSTLVSANGSTRVFDEPTAASASLGDTGRRRQSRHCS
jgi:hypothetical protein